MLESLYSPLRFIRNHIGLTQTEIARNTGLTINDISRFEHGKTGTRIEKAVQIADYLGVSVDLLFATKLSDVASSLSAPAVISRKMTSRIKVRRELCDDIGICGEDWVVAQEVKKLAGTKYENSITSYADDAEAHCDCISFDVETDEAIIIEVKSTNGPESEPFFITQKELALAKECMEKGARYELHRVYFVGKRKRGRKIYTAAELFDLFDCSIYNYTARRKTVYECNP